MVPRIETLLPTKLIGKKLSTSFANDKTFELWRSFSPRKKEIKNPINDDLYSVEIYPDTSFFQNFDPAQVFEKWATIAVSDFDQIPDGMETLTIPSGKYAVFPYKGKPSEAMETFRYIYADWLPNSEYEMDSRPYLALMGAKYKGEHPESEEEFWVPIKKK
ncbi:transcription activator effector binding protein [Allomuricauda ruestringensis DSM 13258]|uniref:Transcription activator effector binding protein n=1 Tax=Allomuricauda ruestringensis (strain DSM 13258 / CIP 107369 / LMG 19739 / B1) TaxID=886377 RepID=G2PMM6_ALLRU|nr:GyrI-like domain-containing protein [Allomuricauda ruestringensis]AEM70133.1 transcription activator effector binding protein [Allomuricauda ruestringensis DSM 13258]